MSTPVKQIPSLAASAMQQQTPPTFVAVTTNQPLPKPITAANANILEISSSPPQTKINPRPVDIQNQQNQHQHLHLQQYQYQYQTPSKNLSLAMLIHRSEQDKLSSGSSATIYNQSSGGVPVGSGRQLPTDYNLNISTPYPTDRLFAKRKFEQQTASSRPSKIDTNTNISGSSAAAGLPNLTPPLTDTKMSLTADRQKTLNLAKYLRQISNTLSTDPSQLDDGWELGLIGAAEKVIDMVDPRRRTKEEQEDTDSIIEMSYQLMQLASAPVSTRNESEFSGTAGFASYSPSSSASSPVKKPAGSPIKIKVPKAPRKPPNHNNSNSNTPPPVCQSCGATETPEWRRGPLGPRTLCNACGLIYAKISRDKLKSPQDTKSVSPNTPVSSQHYSPTDSPRKSELMMPDSPIKYFMGSSDSGVKRPPVKRARVSSGAVQISVELKPKIRTRAPSNTNRILPNGGTTAAVAALLQRKDQVLSGHDIPARPQNKDL